MEPTILYHYTDAAGFLGIVHQPRFPEGYKVDPSLAPSHTLKLLASDVRFMNDRTELRYAGEIFAARFAEAADASDVPDRNRVVLRQLAGELSGNEFYAEPVQVLAACLTENGDQLSQWRGYAGGAGGYAIGISKTALDRYTFAMAASPNPSQIEVGLLPVRSGRPKSVSYELADVEAAASQRAEAIQSASTYPNDFYDVDPAFFARWETVADMALFKHSGFAEEREWRIIYKHAPNRTRVSLPTDFRLARLGLVPCISLAVNLNAGLAAEYVEANWGPRPERTIEDLVVGPSPDQKLRITAAKQLLETNGHDPSVVRQSLIPFRG